MSVHKKQTQLIIIIIIKLINNRIYLGRMKHFDSFIFFAIFFSLWWCCIPFFPVCPSHDVCSVDIMENRSFSVILQRLVIVFGIYLISLPLWGWKLIKVIKRDTNGEVTEYQCWLSFSPFWEHKGVTEWRKKRGRERERGKWGACL